VSYDGELWQRARPVFEAALALPASEREAFVRRHCADDAALAVAVHRLLAAAADDDFLDGPDPRQFAHLAEPIPDLAGRIIGAYRLVRLLGEGGMGSVYLAERADGEFEQQVAIKLMRSGPLSEEAVQRFRRERQILARLDHPNIARLLDGGVTEAGPYLVMEYVEGQPIDEHCTTHGLDLRARIALFLKVCDAVDHAHRGLVVHRDLKPGNILVTADGTVKLLDFGVARMVDASALGDGITQTGPAPLTLEYASPEQMLGEPLTVSADLYSLGSVLYRLLTGHLPHAFAGLSPLAIERRVTEEAPQRPSVHRRELRGDIDTIVLKAIHRDPARRYRSVGELGDDLRRHLERRPVLARPDTLAYRTSRFVRRHAAGVGAAIVVVGAIVVGVLATTSEGRRAQQRFEEVRGLANALLFDLHDAVRDLPGATAAREMLVARAVSYLDVLRRAAPTDPSLQLELAAGYEQIGEIQGDPHRANLGHLAGALASYQQAMELREAVWARDTTDPAVRLALANSYGRLAVVTSWGGDNGKAIELSSRALDLLQPLRSRDEPARAVMADFGRIASELGWWLIWAGRLETGMAYLDTSVAVLRPLAQAPLADPELQLDLWRAYSYQVDGLRFSGRFQPALALLQDTAQAYLHGLLDRNPHHPRVLYALHVCYDFIGAMHMELGAPALAAPAYRTALAFAESMVDADSANQKAFEALARSHASLGDVLVREDRLDDAVRSYDSAIGVLENLYARNTSNIELANMLGNSHRRLCRRLHEGQRPAEALSRCQAGEIVLEHVVANNRDNPIVRANLGMNYVLTARVYRALASGPRRDSTSSWLGLARERYDRALVQLEQLEGVEGNLEIPLDTVRAERDRLTPGR